MRIRLEEHIFLLADNTEIDFYTLKEKRQSVSPKFLTKSVQQKQVSLLSYHSKESSHKDFTAIR